MVSYQRSNTLSRGIPGAGIPEDPRNETNVTVIECRENAGQAAGIIFVVAGLAIAANCIVMFLILSRKSLRR